jgi:hypothetical protein
MNFRKIQYLIFFSVISFTSHGNIDFEEEVLPILQDYCIDCHGPEKPKSSFRVDRRAYLLKGGDSGMSAIIPGKPDKSYMLEVLRSDDPEISMPPKGGPLFEDEIEIIEKWIAEGADWPGQMNDKIEEGTNHWAFLPVERPKVPGTDLNPVDSFLNDRLAREEIPANKMADPLSLIRRASIVLTGLPPKPDRVKKFLLDYKTDPQTTYNSLVDELLSSPHFGERWAQHWLDVIRWAETNGSESNLYRKLAWTYRDYVIRSFNQDVPYDQFVREQIAGDGLGVGEALGFLVAGPHVPAATVGQEPSAKRQARADRMDEIMQTVGASDDGRNHELCPLP